MGSALGIYFFDAQTLEEQEFIPTQRWVRSLAFSPDGSWLASGSYDSTVRIWRVSDRSLARELEGHSGWVRSVAFSPDGNLLATASDDDTVRLWRVSNGAQVLELREGVQGVRAVAFSPDGSILATGGYDSVVRLWRVSDGALLNELSGHGGWVRTLAFSPDGSLLASGGFDATIILWRVQDGALLQKLEEHSSSVLGLAFSPDGTLLASASVDTTVRLWRVPGGEPYALLKGHSDFVYGVAFSPDGESLASVAKDNTVRLWDVPTEASSTAQEIVSAPSNCAACHHPIGNLQPARVLEVACTTCHQDGALVFNWCPIFLRSAGGTTLQVSPEFRDEVVGVPQGSSDMGVVIAAPGNGEHYYGPPSINTSVPINGYVYSTDWSPEEAELLLEVWAGAEQIAQMPAHPDPGGSFSFLVNVVSGGESPGASFSGLPHCTGCHQVTDVTLPPGELRLVVIATGPDGAQTRDERWVHVDNSSTARLPVQVLGEDNQPISNLSVIAETRLYEWRGRTSTGFSGLNGQVDLQIEALSEVPTTYRVFVPPGVVDGVWYESVAPVEITVQPGETVAPQATLEVRQQTGRISGHVEGVTHPIQIWMIHLPDGETHSERTSSQGDFVFSDVPVDEYLLASDPGPLAAEGLALEPQDVDLFQALHPSVNLALSPLAGNRLGGAVMDAEGVPLPFSWVSAESEAARSDPYSGGYSFYDLPDGNTTVLVGAPGYYSQAHVVDSTSAPSASMDFRLVRRPQTTLIPWGNGQVVIPPETIAEAEGQEISFTQGWLWGNGQAESPLLIHWGNVQISIPGGRFALERLPSQGAWLYVADGEASVRLVDGGETRTVGAGEMAYLSKEHAIKPVRYDPVAFAALHSDEALPIADSWEPSPGAQVRDWLARIGIGAAQSIAFVAYLTMFLAVLVVPVVLIYRRLKRG